jgi:hypothetical protein
MLLIFLGAALPSFSQLGTRRNASFNVVVLTDSVTGEKTQIKGGIIPSIQGRLLVEADPNDIRKDIYDKELIIEVIHAREAAALSTIWLTGLRSFEKNDVLKTLRRALQTGDRIVLTFKMMADPEPFFVYIINVR